MEILNKKIRECGKAEKNGILKVDSFLNHQIDVALINELGKEFYRLFGNCGVTKILTVEASGIGVACITAQYFSVPVLFAKKNKPKSIADGVYAASVNSFTQATNYDITVSKNYLSKNDKVLIIDDFLAKGSALMGLISLIHEAGGAVVGAGVVIEKTFQSGGELIRSKGVRVEALAKIKSMTENSIEFED